MKHLVIVSLISLILFPQCKTYTETNNLAPAPLLVNTINLNNIKIGGYLGKKIDLCIKNSIIARNEQDLIEPFRNRTEKKMWQSEFWGKWFLAAAKAYEYTHDEKLKAKLDLAVEGLLETQSKDGYIGNYADDAHLKNWDIWGRKYSMLGLLSYYDITNDNKVLNAVKRLADHLLSEVGPEKVDIIQTGNYRGMASSSILEPIVLLYNRTKEERYLKFARYIVEQWETANGPQLISNALKSIPVAERFSHPEHWWSWENGQKAYEMMSCYDGLLELYKITADQQYLEAVKKVVQNILDTEITIIGSGASVECWYGGKDHQTEPTKHMHETCVTQTWMKLLFKLYQITGDPSLIDCLETTVFNAMLGAMTPDGSSFAKYSPLVGIRRIGEMQCGMDLNCCIANGPRGIMLFPEFTVMKDNEGPLINLYGDITSQITLPSANVVKIEQISDYPRSGHILITLSLVKEEKFMLKLRIPKWSQNSIIAINDEKVNEVQAGQYLRLQRRWRNGDRIELKLDMKIRNRTEPKDHHKHLVLMRGPIVLTRDQRLDNIDVDEVITPAGNKNSGPDCHLLPQSPPFWMVFKIPYITGDYHEGHYGKAKDIFFCDFASAGNSWDIHSRYRVWFPLLLDPAQK